MACLTLEGDANGAPRPEAGSYVRKFSGRYAHRVVKGGVGHNLPQEAPREFARAVIEVDGYQSVVSKPSRNLSRCPRGANVFKSES